MTSPNLSTASKKLRHVLRSSKAARPSAKIRSTNSPKEPKWASSSLDQTQNPNPLNSPSAVPFDQIKANIDRDRASGTRKGPGRPPGKSTAGATTATSPPNATSTSSATGSPFASGASFGSIPQADIPQTKEAFKPLIRQGAELAVGRTGWEGWKIDEPEVEMLAQNCEIVVKTVLPLLGNSPYTPAIVAGCTICFSLGIRFVGYKAWQKEKAASLKAANAVTEPSKEPV